MSLYQSKSMNDYGEFLKQDDTLMRFCPECGMNTTFRKCKSYEQTLNAIKLSRACGASGQRIDAEQRISMISKAMFKDSEGLFVQAYECCMNEEHKRYSIYHKVDNKIIKIGQYPSDVDDNSKEHLDKLKKICSNGESKEIARYISTALIMESYGYGIASLLYMRRAFEKLIKISEQKLNIDSSRKMMKDRIKDNPLLPEQIKNNSRIYNIISEGIHNQTEEECLDIFQAVKIGVIILISKTYAHVEEEQYLNELSKLVSTN